MLCKIYIVLTEVTWEFYYAEADALSFAEGDNGLVLEADYDYDTIIDADTFYNFVCCLDVECLPRLLAQMSTNLNTRFADTIRSVLEKYETVTDI